MPQDTKALVLELLKQADTLKMSVFEQEELSATLRHYSQLYVSFEEIERLCQEVTALLNKVGSKHSSEAGLIKGLKQTGQLLWDHLFTRPVKDRLKVSETTQLILSLDEALINIPWELLYTGEDFLCLKFNLGRLIRTEGTIAPVQYRDFSTVPRMLILANPTDDLKSAYQEGISIKEQFDKRRRDIRIDIKTTDIDKFYVKKNLRDYDIVHFAGHCEYDVLAPQDSGWVLSDGRFSASDIYALAQTLSLPSLIFSNACHSANAEISTHSLASAFLFAGVRHYIGAIRRIEDPVSLVFAREFYARLISGRPVGECMRLSRLKLIKECGLNAISWASYLLYGDPNFILFKIKAKPLRFKIRRPAFIHKKPTLLSLSAILTTAVFIWLYLTLPTTNPNSYLLLLRCKRLFSKGDNQKVIELCQQIISRDPLFLETYPLLLEAYQRLGDKDNSLRYHFQYALNSGKKHDTRNLASAYIGIGWVYYLNADYPKAQEFYDKALVLSREGRDFLNEAVALRKMALWHTDKGAYDKALELLTKSSEINRERQNTGPHLYNLACDYFDIGLVFTNKDDFRAARGFYIKSRVLFEKLKLKNELSDCYFNLGETYLLDKQYQAALDLYMKGLNIDRAQGNIFNLSSDYNMLGELYMAMGNFREAEKFFNQSVGAAQKINAQPELAAAYYNLGLLYKSQNQKDKTIMYLKRACGIYKEIDTTDYQRVEQEILSLADK